MKNKFFFLSTMISSCLLTLACNQATADEMGGGRRCYPASKCTGDPNLIGGSGYRYNSNNAMNDDSGNGGTKMLQTESTEKFVGTVKSVNRVSLPNETQIQIVLSTDQGDMLVIVGPANFVDQAKVKMQAGDKVTVTGYRIKANGNPVIMASEIKKNGYTLELLDENRRPVWGGSSGGQGSGQYSGGYSGSQHPYMPNSRY